MIDSWIYNFRELKGAIYCNYLMTFTCILAELIILTNWKIIALNQV